MEIKKEMKIHIWISSRWIGKQKMVRELMIDPTGNHKQKLKISE